MRASGAPFPNEKIICPDVRFDIGANTREFVIDERRCPGFRENHIELAGLSQARTGFHFVRHEHGREQVLVCFSGRGRVLADNRWQECTAGMAYVTPQIGLHGYQAAGEWEVGWIIFSGHHPKTGDLARARLQTVDPAPLKMVLEGLRHEISTSAAPALLQHWGELLYRYGHRILRPRPGSRLWPLWQAVQARLAHEWNVEELARLAGFSAEYVRRLCLEEFGCSPMRHVFRLRMNQASSLLHAGYKVEAVSEAVGYQSAFSFSTAFKRYMGISPLKFQQSRTAAPGSWNADRKGRRPDIPG